MADVAGVDLRVVSIRRETPDSCSIVLEAPAGAEAGFAYKAGQFLTLRVPHPDGPLPRSYSFCSSSAVGEQMCIAVKRVPDGLASNWINDHLEPGRILRSLPPAGTFTPRSFDDNLLLFAGGSGITPVMSIIKTALAVGGAKLQLFYMNRDPESIIFADALTKLQHEHAGRLSVGHWLESLQGIPGRPDLVAMAEPFASYDTYVCGPSPFMEAVTHALRELGVPPARVHVERFQSLEDDPFARPAAQPAASDSATVALQVHYEGTTYDLRWPTDIPLLECLENSGIEAPYSCRQGLCSACACYLKRGRVRMRNNQILEQEDLDAGLILACQSLPQSDEIEVRYDEDS